MRLCKVFGVLAAITIVAEGKQSQVDLPPTENRIRIPGPRGNQRGRIQKPGVRGPGPRGNQRGRRHRYEELSARGRKKFSEEQWNRFPGHRRHHILMHLKNDSKGFFSSKVYRKLDFLHTYTIYCLMFIFFITG